MGHTPDKTKQNVLMTQNACITKVLTVDGGIVAGSTLTLAGNVNAASDLNISGCMQVGAAGTDIFQILAGSVAASTPVIAVCATGYASALVAGLTPQHKVFVSPSAMSGSLFIFEAYCDATCAALIINLLAAEAVAEDTGAVFSYFALLDA